MKTTTSTILLLLASTPAFAQSAAVLASRNADYVRGLMARGYYDMAKSFTTLVASSNLPEAEKNVIKSIALSLDLGLASLDGDVKKRKEVLLQAIREKEELIAKTPEGQDQNDHRAELAEQYRLLADAFVGVLAEEKDPAKLAEIRKEGHEIFRAAEEALLARRTAVEKLRVEDKPETDIPYVVAFFHLGRTKYFHSLLFPPESFESKKMVEDALTVLDEFDLEFGDLLVNFEAKLVAALCHKQLGDLDQAMGSVEDAIGLRDRFDKHGDVYKVDPSAADVISAAVLQKMIFLKEKGDTAGVLATAKDFFESIPEPLTTSQGLAVLHAQAEMQLQLGEIEAATAAANKLVELNPKNGPWAYRGQQLLSELIKGGGSGGNEIGAGATLKIAQSFAAGGDLEQSLLFCREAIRRSQTPADAKFAAEALLTMGAIYAKRGWREEAVVAFDAVHQRYPKTESAPDALYRAIQCYIELEGDYKDPRHKRWIDERSKKLIANYPDNPKVPQLQLIEGQQLERLQEWQKAAALYEKISPDSPVALEARYRAANCYMRHARKLEAGKQTAQAQQFEKRGVDGMTALLGDLAAAQKATTDPKQRSELQQLDFNARVAVSYNLLKGEKPRADEVLALLKDIELKDENNTAILWALRIRALIVQDKVDEAIALFDEAARKGGDDRALAAASGSLARELDERAVELNKQNNTTAAANLWRRAVGYYLRSSQVAQPDDVQRIADRLFAIGCATNKVDPKAEGFFEALDLRLADQDTWAHSASLYHRLIDGGGKDNDHKVMVFHARTLGFLKRWTEADAAYAQLFAKHPVTSGPRVNTRVITEKPDLLPGFLEWGFAARQAAVNTNDNAKRANASSVFERVLNSVPQGLKYWWFAKYGQIQTMYDRGLYNEADVALRSLELTNPDFEGDRHKLKDRFKLLQQEIKQKLPARSSQFVPSTPLKPK